jgi:hypothetical protein
MDFTVMIVLAVGTLSPDDASVTLRALAPHSYNLVATAEPPSTARDAGSEKAAIGPRNLLERTVP